MTIPSKRPRTLREVAARAASGQQDFDPALREFLDTFYANPDERRHAIALQPQPLDDLRDAWLAAVAEHLARSFNLPVPDWSEAHGNKLRLPYFAGGLESLKAILFVQSPTAFRRRMLFVSKNALSRPRLAEAAQDSSDSG
jgi:hypothetical protein